MSESGGAPAIRPFTVDIPEADLEELRARIAATRFPERETVEVSAKGVKVQVGVSVFADEIYPVPRSWAEQAYPNLVYYNQHDRGGHFAAWEQPQLLSEDVRATSRSLR